MKRTKDHADDTLAQTELKEQKDEDKMPVFLNHKKQTSQKSSNASPTPIPLGTHTTTQRETIFQLCQKNLP